MKPATRNVIIYTLLLLAALAAAAGVMALQKGVSRAEEARAAALTEPAFSRESGFYEEPFELSLQCGAGCEIYYTVDGSDPVGESGPAEKAVRYDAPIRIEDASQHENVYSANTDTSTAFYEDLAKKYSGVDLPGYAAPDGPVDKCTIIRAVAVGDGGAVSSEADGTWFVGKSPADYPDCNIISITTDPANLFDDSTGIYVTGDRFKNYIGRKHTRWSKWDANYWQDGPESERDAGFRMFGPDGSLIAEKDCAIRIQGNVSRANDQKSFSVFFRDEAGGPVKLGTDIFGTGYDPQALILSAGGQNETTKYNSWMVSQVLGNDITMKHYRPAVLFLDGEYWGFYWITERLEEDWFAHYFKVPQEDLVAVKVEGQPDYVIRSTDPRIRETEGDLYERMEQEILSSDMTEAESYEKAGLLLDMDNYIDYYAIEIYLDNYDWPMRNRLLWRTWQGGSGEYADGRWRHVMFDLDKAMQGYRRGFDTLKWARDNDEVFSALWQNQTFRDKFRERIFYYADHYFDPAAMDRMADQYCSRMEPVLRQSWERFFDDNQNTDQFREDMADRKTFFGKRRAVVEKWFE